MTDNNDFDNLRTLHAATTPGEWSVATSGRGGGDHWYVFDADDEMVAMISSQDGSNEDDREPLARSIVVAHNELPALLARLDEVTAERDALAAVVSSVRADCWDASLLDADPSEYADFGEGLDRGAAIRSASVLRIIDTAPSSVLAAHDAKVRAEALREAAGVMDAEHQYEHGEYLRQLADEIAKEENR